MTASTRAGLVAALVGAVLLLGGSVAAAVAVGVGGAGHGATTWSGPGWHDAQDLPPMMGRDGWSQRGQDRREDCADVMRGQE